MLRAVFLWLSEQPRIFGFVRKNRLARKLASRFVAGETVDEAVVTLRDLNGSDLSASLDLLGESVLLRICPEDLLKRSLPVECHHFGFELLHLLNESFYVKITRLQIRIGAGRLLLCEISEAASLLNDKTIILSPYHLTNQSRFIDEIPEAIRRM